MPVRSQGPTGQGVAVMAFFLRRRLAVRTVLGAGLAAAVPLAWAQAPAASYEPSRGQAGKDVIWIPTPDAVVDRMLQMAEVRADDRVYDLGSGDGKIAIAAGRIHGARATGLEFNPQMVELSRRRAQEAGVAGRVDFERADIFAADFSSASVVTLYLLPALNLRLRPALFALRPGTRVVSHSFDMGDWQADEVARSGASEVYLWRIPANVTGRWRVAAGPGAGAPERLRFTQRFQVVDGEATFGSLDAGAIRPVLSGDQLQFGIRDADGRLTAWSGRVDGDRITGTVTRPGAAPVAFEAVRTEGRTPIVSNAPSSRE